MSGARTIFVNSAWMVGAEVAMRVVSLATILYLSRTLAPEGVGIVEFGLAVYGMLHLVTMNGVEARLVPAMVRTPGEATRLAGRSLLLAWAQMIVVLTSFSALAWAVGMSPAMWLAGVGFGSVATFAPLALRFAFIGGERMRPVALGLVVGALTYLGLAITFVRAPDDALRVAGCWVIAMIVRAGIPFVAFVRREGLPAIDLDGFGSDLIRTAGLGIGGIARGVTTSIDVILLGILASPEAVASFGLAAKVPLFLGTLVALCHSALFPSIMRAFVVGGQSRMRQIACVVVEISLGIALPSAVCLAAVSGTVAPLLFTSRFPDVGPLMALLAWRLPLSAMSSLCRTLVWAQSPARDARVAVQMLVATVVVLGGLIAWLGTIGAVLGTLCGDLVGVIAYARQTGVHAIGRLLLPVRSFGIGALVVAVVLAVPATPGPAHVSFVLAAWVLAAAGAVWPRLPLLRRLLDDAR